MENKLSPAYQRWIESQDEMERLVGEQLPYSPPQVRPEQWLNYWRQQFNFWKGYAPAPVMRYIVQNLKRAARHD